jgi:hypothetical protein
VEDYYLAELARADILEAILRPCSPDEIPRYGIPRKKYKFYYEEGLPEMIATDLAGTPLTGGSLPVLQIVCRRLYQKARASPPVRGNYVIRGKDYRDLGGIQGQVDSHLQEALVRCCDEFQLRRLAASLETMRWRDVLSALAKPQADGSITTDVKPEKKLEELAHSKGCRLKFKEVMGVLGKEEWRIVRSVELTKVMTNEKVLCFSLGHDVLGAVLERWSEGRKRDRSGLRPGMVVIGAVFIGLAFLLPQYIKELNFTDTHLLSIYKWLAVALGAVIGLLAAVPNNHRFQFLYRPIYGLASDLRGLWRIART